MAFATAPHPGISSAASLGCGPHAGRYTEGNTVGQVASDLARRRAHTPRLRVIFYWSDRHTSRHSSMLSSSRLRIFLLHLLLAGPGRADDVCSKGLCSVGRTDNAYKMCCDGRCKRCGGAGCGAPDNGASADVCCPAKWSGGGLAKAPICVPGATSCKMPPAAAACAVLAAGKSRQRKPKRAGVPGGAGASGSGADAYECRCHGPYTRAYRGACLPSFMVIGSQKAATSKLRWYLSRHPSIDIPKEEAFHGGPNAVLAWDTASDPTKLSSYLDAFEDVCNSSLRISGLKMPDYIVMSEKTIQLFHLANPTMRVVVTLREPVARMYSYFSMQLRFGWSPINHMGKNPCMQRRLRALLQSKEQRHAAALLLAGGSGASSRSAGNGRRLAQTPRGDGKSGNATVRFTSEEIMVTNLECVRPCYANNASGVGDAARSEIWHDENRPECRNIYFTPLVHSMYALHLRRWLKTFSRESLLLLRFDDIVLRPVDVLQRVAKFLALPPFPSNFKVEYGRENYTTIARLLKSGAVTPQNLKALEDFFRPHDATLREMFGGEAFW